MFCCHSASGLPPFRSRVNGARPPSAPAYLISSSGAPQPNAYLPQRTKIIALSYLFYVRRVSDARSSNPEFPLWAFCPVDKIHPTTDELNCHSDLHDEITEDQSFVELAHQNQDTIGGDPRSLEIHPQRTVKGELNRPVLSLTRWVLAPDVSFVEYRAFLQDVL